jgi:hypothetical protein
VPRSFNLDALCRSFFSESTEHLGLPVGARHVLDLLLPTSLMAHPARSRGMISEFMGTGTSTASPSLRLSLILSAHVRLAAGGGPRVSRDNLVMMTLVNTTATKTALACCTVARQ